MNITRQVKLDIISDAADLMEQGRYSHCCNALQHTIYAYLEENYEEKQLWKLVKEIQDEFWKCIMLDGNYGESTAGGRLISLGYYPWDESNKQYIEFRIQMLALYYELVRRGHTFKDFHHVT